ncbi:MAG: selenobiotic family radical SAM modification target peptide [Desulfarculaceae bacterium]|nr:selenobiotic family radical SAM modification target peptide [Desulfarculaceae bacterium]
MQGKQLKKILAGLCITGLVSGVGLVGCGGGAACEGIAPEKAPAPKPPASATQTKPAEGTTK